MSATCSLWLLCHNEHNKSIVTTMSQYDNVCYMFIVTTMPQYVHHVHCDYYATMCTACSSWLLCHNVMMRTTCKLWLLCHNKHNMINLTSWLLCHDAATSATCSLWLICHNEHNKWIVTTMSQYDDVCYMFIVTTMPQCVRHVHCDYYATMCTTCSLWLLGHNEHSMENCNY
jgi:hypothetical protein